jgi:hypothetical protein
MHGRGAAGLVEAVIVPGLLVATAVPAAAAPVDGLEIARGVVVDTGRPQPADVVAIAWPDQQVLEKLRQGDVVPMYVIGRTTTDASGRFAISARPTDLPAQFRDARGRVDVELVIGSAGREIRYNYTTRSPDADHWVATARGGVPAQVQIDFGRATAFNVSDDPAGWTQANGRTAGAPGRSALAKVDVAPMTEDLRQLLSTPLGTLRRQRLVARAALTPRPDALGPQAVPCFTYAGQKIFGRPESFLHALGWAGAKLTVYQNEGNEHTLGIGFKSSGGAWSANGSRTITLAGSAERAGVVDAWAWNKVNYRDYLNSCAHTVQRRPLSVYALLAKWTRAYHPVYKACTRYTGGTYTKFRGTNTTYGAGTDIGPINVSAQSGWDRDTQLKWTVTRSTKLCGSQPVGWVTSRDVEAHKG